MLRCSAPTGLRFRVLSLLVVPALTLSACNEEPAPAKAASAAAAAPKVAEPPGAKEPPVPAKMRTVEVTAAKTAKGKEKFEATCAACHGKRGVGRVGVGPALNSKTFLAAASDEMLTRTILKGRAGTTMIAWGAMLKGPDVENVISYIRSWKKVEAATLDESPVAGDAVNGKKLFSDICSGCHGRTGAGYQEIANGTGIGRKAFMKSVTNGFIRYLVNHGKSGTKMRPMSKGSKVAVADLTKKEIEDVLAHLRESAW